MVPSAFKPVDRGPDLSGVVGRLGLQDVTSSLKEIKPTSVRVKSHLSRNSARRGLGFFERFARHARRDVDQEKDPDRVCWGLDRRFEGEGRARKGRRGPARPEGVRRCRVSRWVA